MTQPTATKEQRQVLKAVIPQSDPQATHPWREGSSFWWVIKDRIKEAFYSLMTPTGILALGVTLGWLVSVVLKALHRVDELPIGWDPVVWAWGLHIGNNGVRTVSQGAAAGMILRNGKVYPSPDEEDG